MFDKLKGDPIMGLLLIAFGLLFLIPSLDLGLLAPKGIAGPGAGFFPAVTSSFVIFFGIWIIYDAIKVKNTKYFEDDAELSANFKILFLVVLGFIVFLLIWYFINFFLGIAILCLFYNYLFKRSIVFNVIFTLIFVALLYGVFEKLLYIQFTL